MFRLPATVYVLRPAVTAAPQCARFLSLSAQGVGSISASSDPSLHSAADISKLYTIDSELVRTLHKHALPRRAVKEVDSLGQLSVVLRKPSAEIVAACQTQAAHKFVLYGRAGTGKTYELLNVLSHCVHSKWLVAHVPFGLKWTHNSGDLDRSMHRAGQVDQNVDGAAWLQYFMALNGPKLGAMPLVGHYTWGSRKIVMPEKSTLLQLCNLGIREQRFASDVVGVVLKEIHEHADVPVLVAIDEINGMLESATATHGFDQKILAPSQLSLISHFLAFVDGRKTLRRGAVVVATSSGQGVLPTRSVQPGTDKFLSLAASPSAAAKDPNAFIKLHVAPFNEAEVSTLLSYYKATGWMSKNFDQKFRNGLKLLSDNVPQTIAHIAKAV